MECFESLLCAHILHFLMLKQFLPGVYAFIKKIKQSKHKVKRDGGDVGDSFFWKSQS